MDCPPRWESIGQRLEEVMREVIFRQIGKHRLSDVEPKWEELTRRYFGEEYLNRPKIDSVCRHIAKHGIAPSEISPEVRYYLLFRIQCALDFIGMVFPPQSKSSPFSEIPRAWSDEQVIEWLLVDIWLRRFDHWLKLNAIGVLGPYPFYGMEPADPSMET